MRFKFALPMPSEVLHLSKIDRAVGVFNFTVCLASMVWHWPLKDAVRQSKFI